MPVKQSCIRILHGLANEAEDAKVAARDIGRSLDITTSYLFRRGVSFIRRLGPAGEELARQTEQVFRPAQRRFGEQTSTVNKALAGLTTAEREQAAKLADGIKIPNASAKVRAAGKVMKDRLDMDMRAAGAVGLTRSAGSAQLPISGSGRAFPTMLNRDGRRIVRLAAEKGGTNPRVKAFLERLVREGRYPDEATALGALQAFHDYQLRGTNAYFERIRFDFPPEFREWDPRVVLPETFRRNALTIEGVKRWGVDFEGLRPIFGEIRKQGGPKFGAKLSETSERFIQAQFGVSGLVPPWNADLANSLSNWETVSKLSGFFSPILQIGQRYVNTIDAPISAVLKANRDLPPVINAWLRGSDAVKREIERSGAISGFNALTEFARGDRTLGQRLTRTILTPFMAAARGNEYASALVARYALEADVAALARMTGNQSRLTAAMNMIRYGALDPKGVLKRRIARRGVDPDQLAKKWARGQKLTDDEFFTVMQKAVEDEQFALNMITEPVWWHTQPWLRLAWKFKTFGIRQTEFLVEHVVKEARYGNMAPALKIIAFGAIMGEVYHLSKDLLTGRDESVTSLLMNRDPSKRTQQEVAARVISNFVAQGGLGMIADLSFGIGQYVGGPALSTAQNAMELATHIVHDPAQAALAVRNMAEREIVVLPQAQKLIDQAQERLAAKDERARDYQYLRDAVREFRLAKESVGLRAQLKSKVLNAFQGPVSYETTEKTLRYRYAARAITGGDIEDATEYLGAIFEEAKTRGEIEDMARAARLSMQANAPLGQLNEDARKEFLGLLPPDRKARFTKLRNTWIRDYEKAITKAELAAKRGLRTR